MSLHPHNPTPNWRIPSTLYHGTSEKAWAGDDSGLLHLTEDLETTEYYANIAGRTDGSAELVLAIPFAAIRNLQLEQDWGTMQELPNPSEDFTWKDSLRRGENPFVIVGDIEKLKSRFEVVP